MKPITIEVAQQTNYIHLFSIGLCILRGKKFMIYIDILLLTDKAKYIQSFSPFDFIYFQTSVSNQKCICQQL